MIDTSVIRERFSAVGQELNERSRRLLAAAEAKTAGHGGIGAASRATGVARSTIGRGLKDLADPGSLSVIAHPAPAIVSPRRLVDITNLTVSSTEARLAFAVLTTERKAA